MEVLRIVKLSFWIPLALFAATATSAARQAGAVNANVSRVVASAEFKTASAFLDSSHDRLVQEIVQLTEIPAPPFKETARGRTYLDMLRQAGLTSVETDPEGNVMGIRKGAPSTALGPSGLVVIAAHLDTVFPEGTDVKVKRSGTRLAAPGIGDNTRGLAVLLAIIRAMDAAKIRTAGDILFVGNVGEEGPGDLRGIRYLFQRGRYKDQIKTFISVDGAGPGSDVTNGGVGSKRYRVAFKGPGGHSYGAFGLVNPAFAMGAAMAKMGDITVPKSPKTTYSVGVVGGGTSVNSIPFETWMEIDLRSESAAELVKLDTAVAAVMTQSADQENRARSVTQGRITVEMKLIGDRPSGETPRTSPIAQTAAAAITAMNLTPAFTYSSTDSNIPMSLGIPAITLDSGGSGGRAHALDEWIDVEKAASLKGMRCILATLLSLAEMRQ